MLDHRTCQCANPLPHPKNPERSGTRCGTTLVKDLCPVLDIFLHIALQTSITKSHLSSPSSTTPFEIARPLKGRWLCTFYTVSLKFKALNLQMSEQEKSEQRFSTKFWMLTNQQLGHKPVAPFSVAHHFSWPFMLPVKMKIAFYFIVDLIASMMWFLMCFGLQQWKEWVYVPFTKSITAECIADFRYSSYTAVVSQSQSWSQKWLYRACTAISWSRVNLQGYCIFPRVCYKSISFQFCVQDWKEKYRVFQDCNAIFFNCIVIYNRIHYQNVTLEFSYNVGISS